MNLRCGLSTAFYNKQNLTGHPAAFGFSFIPTELSVTGLIAHITGGSAWTQGCFSGRSRTKQTFVSAQTLALDLDNAISVDQALADPFIGQYAALVHPSASSTPAHPKTRVVFVLSEPVAHRERWETLQRSLIARCAHLHPDPACKDAARLFYGSDQPSAYARPEARLPLTIAGGLTNEEALADDLRATADDAPAWKPDTGSDREYARRYVDQAIDDELAILAAAGKGERNTQLFKSACALFGFAKAGYTETAALERALETAAAHTGLPLPEIQATLRSAFRSATPRDLPAPTPRTKRKKIAKLPLTEQINPVTLPPFTPDLTVHLPYISDLDLTHLAGYQGVLIKSPIGTGKTELGLRLIQQAEKRLGRAPTVLVITYRRALVEDIARRWELLAYTDLPGDGQLLLPLAPQLAISYDSLWRVAGNAYDLVFIDEISQFHPHLEAGTMRAGEPRRSYAALKGLVQNCGQFIGLDAHNCDIAVQWVRQLKGDLTVAVDNTYRVPKGDLTLHSSKDLLYRTTLELAARDEGCIVIACSSKHESILAHRLLTEAFGAEQGRLINADNSESRDTQAFIAAINRRLPVLKFLVFSPSLGTGIDITAPVRAVLGIFGSQPLAPADMLQMLGRCRRAQERHVYVQPATGNRETDWQVLYAIDDHNAATTATLSHFDRYRLTAADPLLRGISKLQCQYRAQRNAAMNDPISYFVSLSKEEGYTLRFHEGEDKGLRLMLKTLRQNLNTERAELVLHSPPVSHEELENHRRSGTITPLIRAGYERFKIEDTVGLTINPQIYDDLRTAEKRTRLRRFAAIFDNLDNLQAADREEAADGYLLSQRQHRVAARSFVEDVVRRVFHCGIDDLPTVLQDIPGTDLEARLDGLANLYHHQLVHLLGWRPGHHTHNPVALLRWIFGRIGLKLVSHQLMRDGVRFRVYSLDLDQWERLRAYAAARLAHLEQKRQSAAITQNRFIPLNPVSSNLPPHLMSTAVDERSAFSREHTLSLDRA